jgi:hypothetical protein
MLDGIRLIHVAVHREAVALAPRPTEDVLELDRGIVLLVRVQAHADDPLLIGQRLLEGLHGGVGGHVPEEAHDELGAQTERSLSIPLSAMEALDACTEGNPARRVGLRIEEDLGVDDVLGMSLLKVRHGEPVEVLLGDQHTHALVVDGEERGQVVEIVGGPQLVYGAIGKLEAVVGGQLELELGLQGTFEMQVQLGLGHPFDE